MTGCEENGGTNTRHSGQRSILSKCIVPIIVRRRYQSSREDIDAFPLTENLHSPDLYPLNAIPHPNRLCAASIISHALVVYPMLIVRNIPSKDPFMSLWKTMARMDLVRLQQKTAFILRPH